MKKIRIENLTHPLKNSLVADVCDNFWLQFRGLMFRPDLKHDQGLVFFGAQENRIDSSIHMFFMKFDIAVVWLNKNNQVVDVRLAHRWPPIYIPKVPAVSFLELHALRLGEFQVGDYLALENA